MLNVKRRTVYEQWFSPYNLTTWLLDEVAHAKRAINRAVGAATDHAHKQTLQIPSELIKISRQANFRQEQKTSSREDNISAFSLTCPF